MDEYLKDNVVANTARAVVVPGQLTKWKHEMIISIRIICCMLMSFVLSGCGLVFVPDVVTVPEKPLQTILVVDQQTKQPILNAKVSCGMYRWENWLAPFTFWSCTSPAETPKEQAENDSGHEHWEWEGRAIGNGIYKQDSKVKVGSVQIWFPIPLPLGWNLYKTYYGSICISAPGYKTVCVSSDAINGQGQFIGSSRDSLNSKDFFLVEGNQTTIMLPRDLAVPQETK